MIFLKYSVAVGQMARSPAVNQGQRQEAQRFLTKLIAETMGVDIVGFWHYSADRRGIINECSYHRKSGQWSSGFELQQAEHPRYFNALYEEKLVAVADCFNDPIMQDFKESYLRKFDIHALLDTPIFIDGQMVGILCCEVTGGTRAWTSEDKLFALNCADSFARALENEKRKKFEIDLRSKLMKETIDLSEAQLRTMVLSLPFAVALFDRELRLLAMSGMWAKHYPFTDPAPLNKPIYQTSQFLPLWIENMRKVLGGRELGVDEQYAETPLGPRWIMWRMIPWRNLEGEIEGLLISYEDITERKETEIHLRQTAKLTALGEMAGGIAHEINNPLSILKGFIDLMRRQVQRGTIEQSSFQQYLERSYSTVDRIGRIVAGMRRIARDSSLDDMESYSVNSLVEDALDFVREKFREGQIDLRIQTLTPDVKVLCRSVEISQVLLNLLTNSYHAVEKASERWVRIVCSLQSSSVRISIEDSGPGVPAELREKIFQPFFTTKDIGQGTGLGLSISRKILENHNGQLYLDNSVPQTRFTLEFPLR